MSAQSKPSEQPVEKTRGRTPNRRMMQSGYSLLARGEPLIWFTGGMLVICLLMITCLLGFILYSGLPTFWPREVQWVLLNNGTQEIGQLQTTEVDQNAVGQVSRYYRTGNFDLTGQHYRWLTSSELDGEGLSKPQWAMVVERLEHGRLYGILNQMTIATDVGEAPRRRVAEAERLKELIETIPSISAEILPQVYAALASSIDRELDAANRSLLPNLEELPGLLQVRLATETNWQLASQLAGDNVVVASRRVISSEADVFEQLDREVARTTTLRHQIEALRYQISRRDAQLSEMRAEVRRAEISANQQVALPLESAHYFLDQLELLHHRSQTLAESMELLREIAGPSDWQAAVLQAFQKYEAVELPQQVSRVQQQLVEAMEPIQKQAVVIRDAVAAYHVGYQEIVAKKRPLEMQLQELNALSTMAEVDFLVPFAPVTVAVEDADIDRLVSGTIPETLRQHLATQSILVSESTAEVTQLNGRLTWVSCTDSLGQKHVFSVAAIEGESTPSELGSNPSSRATRQVQLLQTKLVNCREIVRAFPANQLGLASKVSTYLGRWGEFLLENPREAGAEGGVFPAIWGTIVMTLIMTIAVVPFGVMAALYLREYTKSGPLVSLIRISINNLAGVPSIVYGVFGFSFFCYTIGAYVDGGAKNAGIEPWPSMLWYLALGGIVAVGTVAFLFSFLSSGPSHTQTGFKRFAARAALVLWLVTVAAVAILLLKSPFFEGFYREYLPNPTFGKGGLLWAALTLSLLTLPVVIVATEEALAAVPNSLREGSLACGASKWQTIQRIILPHSRPGILTGAILAMARGAGEVAPLMLVGALASAPDLPLDTEFPFFHGSRSFMHLGYQIYTLGFQSQNSEAAKPMVFTCTLLLILIVAALNITAIYLRSRLKRQFQGNQF